MGRWMNAAGVLLTAMAVTAIFSTQAEAGMVDAPRRRVGLLGLGAAVGAMTALSGWFKKAAYASGVGMLGAYSWAASGGKGLRGLIAGVKREFAGADPQ